MINTIVMTNKFAEDSTISFLIFQSRKNFKTAKEALESFTLTMYNCYMYDVECSTGNLGYVCCRKFSKNKDFVFCPKCGKQLNRNDFNHINFNDYIINLHSEQMDSLPEFFTDEHNKNPDGWNTIDIDFSKAKILYIQNCAASVISIALYKINSEYCLGIDEIYCADIAEEEYRRIIG